MASLKSRFEYNLMLLVLLVTSSRNEKCPNTKGHFWGFSLENSSLHIGTVKVYSQVQCFDQCLRKQGCVYYNFHHISTEGLHICELFKMEIEIVNETQILPRSDSTFSWLEVDVYSSVSNLVLYFTKKLIININDNNNNNNNIDDDDDDTLIRRPF